MRRLLTYVAPIALFLAASIVVVPVGAEENISAVRNAFQHMVAGEYDKTLEIVTPLAEAGDADAQHLLAYLHENGLGQPRDLIAAIDFYAKAALQGQVDAQFALGELAFLGDGVRQDDERAAGWYKLAVRQGHAGAKMRLGFMYMQGVGVAQDKKEARRLFEDAAAAGEPESQYNLGVMLMTGDGVKQNYKKAAEWFEKSAAQGHPDSQYNLALLYDSDFIGAPDPDSDKSLRWMLAAAEGGLPAAMVAMGLLTHDGRATGGDLTPGQWFEQAAVAGDPQGQFLHAVTLAQGDGREKNLAEAMVWLQRAMEQGDVLGPEMRQNAQALRAELAAELAR